MIYQATPDYYNDVIQHYGVKGMKWKHHKLKNPYVELHEGMGRLENASASTASKAVRGAFAANRKFNSYMNNKAASAGKAIAGEASKRYRSASGRATSIYNKLSSSARKKASSIYKTGSAYAGKVKSAYDENRKSRQMVAAGKKNIKKHNVNRRIQKRVESDNAVYARAFKNARRTIKRRKSN